jgi:EAL and modified HD-GYP domain-containing signal transduction protein
MERFVARQPILNRRKKVYGYELLHRGSLENRFPAGIDGNQATSSVLATSFLGVGLEEITESKLAFINFTEQLLLDGTPNIFPPKAIVIELLEDIRPVPKVLEACQNLQQKGYTLALDDFNYLEEFQPLLDIAHIIKVDIEKTPIETIEDKIEVWSRKRIKLLAERVETYDQFNQAMENGFHYFQGYFFNKPEVLKHRDITSTKANLLALLMEVNKKDFSFKKIEKRISSDPALSYKLLRFINSAYYYLVREVTTIRHAIAYLGERDTRLFVSLVATTELACDKPDELLRTSIIRAKFCQSLGERSTNKEVDDSQLFILGLFSLLDAMLDTKMEEICTQIVLDEAVKEALINKTGPYAIFLDTVLMYEQARWSDFVTSLSMLGLTESEVLQLYPDAVRWSAFICDE